MITTKMIEGIPSALLLNLENMKVSETVALDDFELGNRKLSNWEKKRLGKITGSNFGKIKRGKTKGTWSETAETYMAEIIWETITGIPASRFTGSVHTDWGNRYEPTARKMYEEKTGQTVKHGKFYKAKGFRGLIGCTPDGVGRKALEIKCPYSAKAHLLALMSKEVPEEYKDQVYGHMLCTRRKKVDFVSFDPRILKKRPDLAMVIIPVSQSELYMAELEERLRDFENEILHRLSILKV